MAGSSPSPSDKLSAATLSPKVKTTEKKKRKRPSKKVPTTVLESSSTDFLDLVQKLTGSAGESSKPAPPSLAFSPSLSLANSTTSGSSPYSSPSCDYADPRWSYQQLLHNASTITPTTTTTTTTDDDDSSFNPNPMASLYANDDLYSSYSASSRATENDVLPFSSSFNWFSSEMRA